MRQKEITDQGAGDRKGGRTLGLWVVLFTALVMLLAILAMPYVRQYNAVQWIQAQGGTVYTEANWLTARLPTAATDWLSDKGWLVNVQRVTAVDLNGTQVTGAGFEHLLGMTSLQTIGLIKTQVTDAGLEHLKGLTTLQHLYLSGTQVGDAGLRHLKEMTGLQTLILQGTQVSQAGADDLKAALPSLTIL